MSLMRRGVLRIRLASEEVLYTQMLMPLASSTPRLEQSKFSRQKVVPPERQDLNVQSGPELDKDKTD